MARKPRGPHPSTMGGEPLHGEEFPEDDQINLVPDDEDEDEEPVAKTESELLREEIALMRRENQHLKRSMTPAPAPVVNDDEEEPDWENLIFADPKAAVKQIQERTEKKVKRELRSEYQQDAGHKEFWGQFYAANGDLKEDDDLVQTTLNSNLDKLADLPVEKAMSELADLTRKRIMRYSNGKGKSRSSRAVAEGASTPTSRKPAPEKSNVTTLADVIKNRKAQRRKAASAA